MSHPSEPATSLVSPVSDAVFRPVREGNAFEETVERLLQAIRLGVVGPGERFPAERDLAARLGVSRVTLADAIRVLQENGYVESQRGRYGGTFVKERQLRPSRAAARRLARHMGPRLDDALVLREVLESGAAEVAAAAGLGSDERVYLRDRLHAASDAPLSDYRRRDSQLHLAIAEVAGSPSLTSAVAQVRTRLNELLDAIPLLERNIEHSDEQHDAIIEAILTGDRDHARRAMLEHLDGTAALLRGFLS
jgi:DNA-binding FadR family transcriptional regulator